MLAGLRGCDDARSPIGETVLFWLFAAAAIVCAILMITNRNPVYSALWFALVTLSVCGLFLLQSAPFLAAATVIVYAGAIVVTFVFVIMLAQQSGATVYDQRSRQPLLATVAAFLLLGALHQHAASRRQRRAICNVADGQPTGRRRPIRSASSAEDEPLGTMHGLGPLAVRRLLVRGRTGGHAAAGGHDRRDRHRAAPAARGRYDRRRRTIPGRRRGAVRARRARVSSRAAI